MAPTKPDVPHRTIARLSVYRRVAATLRAEGRLTVYSHEISGRTGNTAAQVRRDLMSIGFTGSPARGYSVPDLADRIAEVLDSPEGLRVALVGVGNLGRAILAYFLGRRSNVSVVAAFDASQEKAGRVTHGCRVFPATELPRLCRDLGVQVGVITVPADAAQEVADLLVQAGVKGIVNFAPTRLRVVRGVYVEDVDITTVVEKVGYFALRNGGAMADEPEESGT